MLLRISLCCFSMCLVRLADLFQIIPPILIHLQKLIYQNPIYNLLTTHLRTNLLPIKFHTPTFYHEPTHLYILCHQGNKIFLFLLSYPPASALHISSYLEKYGFPHHENDHLAIIPCIYDLMEIRICQSPTSSFESLATLDTFILNCTLFM